MGMYTQIRGWLNLDSIGDEHEEMTARFHTARHEFLKAYEGRGEGKDRQWVYPNPNIQRASVCLSSWIHTGGNGTAWIFFGVEYKNYDDSFDEWLKFLLSKFPSAEGRIEYHYEEASRGSDDPHDAPDQSRFILVYKGEIIQDGYQPTWTHGYGNCEARAIR